MLKTTNKAKLHTKSNKETKMFTLFKVSLRSNKTF